MQKQLWIPGFDSPVHWCPFIAKWIRRESCHATSTWFWATGIVRVKVYRDVRMTFADLQSTHGCPIEMPEGVS
eukprot:scaffold143253_cov18-Tisochrysis_lutea.AAC.1